MKLSIMQPYFLPYLGYFALIKYSDRFILLDTVQYIRHGWINRNRILHPSSGWQYIILPLKKHTRATDIKDVLISDSSDWRNRILAQLQHYKKIAPYYEQIIILLEKCFFNFTGANLSKLNATLLSNICEYLNFDHKISIFSEMNMDIGQIKHPGEWALRISHKLSANNYINPPGGKDIFNREQFQEYGIKLQFLEIKSCRYNQKRDNFEEGLSIIDVMMFNSSSEINKYLDNYKLFK